MLLIDPEIGVGCDEVADDPSPFLPIHLDNMNDLFTITRDGADKSIEESQRIGEECLGLRCFDVRLFNVFHSADEIGLFLQKFDHPNP